MTKKNIGITVVLAAVLFIVTAFVAFVLLSGREHTRAREWRDLTSVTTVLLRYAELHEGNLPSSLDDLVTDGIINRLGGSGQIISVNRIDSPEPKAESWTVNIHNYRIAWGTRPEAITVTDTDVLGPEFRGRHT